jgi:hypothetical protein
MIGASARDRKRRLEFSCEVIAATTDPASRVTTTRTCPEAASSSRMPFAFGFPNRCHFGKTEHAHVAPYWVVVIGNFVVVPVQPGIPVARAANPNRVHLCHRFLLTNTDPSQSPAGGGPGEFHSEVLLGASIAIDLDAHAVTGRLARNIWLSPLRCRVHLRRRRRNRMRVVTIAARRRTQREETPLTPKSRQEAPISKQ